ncbi:putative heavy metal-associated domain, HMA, heavy metal-associated domain superfamily [Dioscorea sansibarensis]
MLVSELNDISFFPFHLFYEYAFIYPMNMHTQGSRCHCASLLHSSFLSSWADTCFVCACFFRSLKLRCKVQALKEETRDIIRTRGGPIKSVELKVEMVAIHEKRLRKCLSKIRGIEKVEVEASIQKVVVTGYAHKSKILKALRRVGLRAEFWSAQNEILHAYASGSFRINNFSFF